MLMHLRDLFSGEGMPAVVMMDNRPPFNGKEFRQFAQEFVFVHQKSSPHFHQSNGFIELMVKKVKATFKKADGATNAQAQAMLQLWDTPIASDLPSPVEILHGHPTQGAVLPRPHRPINTQQICRKLIEIQNAQKEQFEHTEQRTWDPCSWENKWDSFLTSSMALLLSGWLAWSVKYWNKDIHKW